MSRFASATVCAFARCAASVRGDGKVIAYLRSRMLNFAPHVAEAIDEARARVRLFPWWLKPFLARGVIGITLGRTIYLSEKYVSDSAAKVERLLRHELAHVRQVNRLGVLRFLALYVAEYVRNLRAGMTCAEAYRAISFEVEAYAAEEVG